MYLRYMGFAVCFGLGIVCFIIALTSLPFIVLGPAKFASTYTLGSLLLISSLALLRGPRSFLRNLLLKDRLPFTLIYLTSVGLTIYFSLILGSYFLSFVLILFQIGAGIWYIFSYFPGESFSYRPFS